ncbi:MAG: endolytic transglycosylase MltG [Sphingobacteriales bacterium]|jgi:UPF0755 protein|nr:endolytic transglycosylase MltG [Sphingobacteriales bacterium]MBP9142727.1 endolytic transglycosylase MltG [Chitinophagales bacterium]MDA0199747.1 endolytic transglycosylase MltG [Bacteroidota bacterium]MBK6890278.1 endolytic transglycosylase MltG [Sphingobacteriales bacterium]MBK7527195.1 endolytic transglycosylase MltG [Sphingobacteriales bacterium]
MSKPRSIAGKIIKILLFLLFFGGIVAAVAGWWLLYKPNVNTNTSSVLFIRTNATYQEVLDSLAKNGMIASIKSFDLVARQMNYPKKIQPGRYLLNANMSNRSVVNLLRSGQQTPVNISLDGLHTLTELVAAVHPLIEADSAQLATLLSDTAFLQQKNLNPTQLIGAFFADTYQFNWNTSAEQFFDRMYKIYANFWTDENLEKAKALGLTQFEANTLASIVTWETAKTDEMPKVARVYLNRLAKNERLHADPTVIFAVGDFTIKRVTKNHTQINSPYNTYRNFGLPPGPVRTPNKAAMEAVLNPAEGDYMYFCAKEDFSGYHNFANTYQEHQINTQKYHDELNRRGL